MTKEQEAAERKNKIKNILEDYFRYEGRIRYKEVGKNEICEELVQVEYMHYTKMARLLTSNPAIHEVWRFKFGLLG